MHKDRRWNRDEWQGRSRQSVEGSLKCVGVALGALVVLVTFLALAEMFQGIFSWY